MSSIKLTRGDNTTPVIAANMRALRYARGWSAQRVADAMAAAGLPWSRGTVASLENGWRSTLTVDELLALGDLFGVEPWKLTRAPGCSRCGDRPPAGFICGACRRRGRA